MRPLELDRKQTFISWEVQEKGDQQPSLFSKIEQFVQSNLNPPSKYDTTLALEACYPAQDRKFLRHLAAKLNMFISFDEFNENDEPLINLVFDPDQSTPEDPAINAVQDILEEFQLGQPIKPETDFSRL
ncbi:hypothetical protein PGT21_020040 [Puccinia graminis f. sp. tritici]|uniref:Uncharacterized protein n=2 Tax=Puccinia graminis f. sp. tritici TaxID=56615 RepID=H6QVC9_PUCGT|nr:uncharacterized protein PGTG_22650 [Puccinia graminis f. sp. tritici CRL 75-36-700-3]EHS62858.1 hypothetical protein PGTG_22650 [Puccinia graminis f. sp. tritici CRL 75-36-700-3]KAA1087009.1 hypothetical protein PGT21_019685 [Puccinia graminis f. sp. tritici]KAA1087038.1 hypothetical protein PGT21_020040 [Puccinia graminis f. sp. tritici]